MPGMRAVIQRVNRASVAVAGAEVGSIGRGVLVFLGVGQGDTREDMDWLIGRITRLRIWEDDTDRMNYSLLDIDGEALVISQFTLFGNLKKGNRPSFNRAALPGEAIPLYEQFVERLSAAIGKPVPTGRFGQHMDINAENDGPVTLVLDTRQKDF